MFSYSQWALDWLSKAAGHKYIKRVPYQSGGKMRYRYIYNVTHTHGGKHVLDPDHMKVGTKLMLDATSGAEVHGHIQSVSGDKVTFVYDDGSKKGESVTMSKDKLATELDKVHGISGKLDAARKKQSDIVAKLKEKGASAKQIARAEARLKALGGDTPKAKLSPREAREKEQADAIASLDQEFPLAGIKASDLSLEAAQESYRGVSMWGKERGLRELLDFKGILEKLEDMGRRYIEAGASEDEVAEVVSTQARKILRANQALINARTGTMRTNITGRAKFNNKRQEKKMDTYDKRFKEFREAVDTAEIQVKKLDPKSRPARFLTIEQGRSVEEYQTQLDKLVSLQSEYKKLRAKARKEGKEPEFVIPQYLLTQNNQRIKQVKELIENEERKERLKDVNPQRTDYTLPSGLEISVEKNDRDNRIGVYSWDDDDDFFAWAVGNLMPRGYKRDRITGEWRMPMTPDALDALSDLLAARGAVEGHDD